MDLACSGRSKLLLCAVELCRVVCYSHEGSRRCRHAQALHVVAVLEAHALAVGASTVVMRRQWTSIAVTWHRCRRWAWSACAEARFAQFLLGSARRDAHCCALPFGVQVSTDWPYARWCWFRPRVAQRGQSPVVHAPEEMTGCTAARCSDSLVASEPCEHQRRVQ